MLQCRRLLAMPLLLVATCLTACSQPPSTAIRVQLPEDAKHDLRVFDNSDTFSRCIALNDHGAVLGVREVVDEKNPIFSLQNFYNDGNQSIDVHPLDGFTNLELEAFSDTGRAVGFSSRPIGHPEGSLTAIVWDSISKRTEKMGELDGDTASHAQDISADGQFISGYSTGANPARLRPVVWSWNDKQKKWDAQALSTIEQHNPYLMAGRAVISPDGKRVAACITEAFHPGGIVDSSLYIWDLVNGNWNRSQISKVQLRLSAINNQGMMVGTINMPTGKRPCRIDLAGKIKILQLLEGDVSGEALDINEAGVIVGLSDDPPGPDGGPEAFSWQDGKSTALPLPAESLYSAAYAINNHGQIAGFADVTLPGDLDPASSESGEPEAIEKTLGFLLSPTKHSSVGN